MSRSEFAECVHCGTGFIDVSRLRYGLHRATCGRLTFLCIVAGLLAVLGYVLFGEPF